MRAMKTAVSMAVMIGAVAMAGVAGATGTCGENSSVERSIDSAITQADLANYVQIGVEVNSGVITLTGTARNRAAEAAAIRIARDNAGGRQVVSKMAITPPL